MAIISTVSHGVKILIALVCGVLLILIVTWGAREIFTPKDFSKIQGIWLAHDGDEQMYGQLKLHIIGDSAYFGSRTFADGRPDTLYSVLYKMRITEDSLLLSTDRNRDSYGWGLEYLDEKHLVLKGDSHSYDFIKQGAVK